MHERTEEKRQTQIRDARTRAKRIILAVLSIVGAVLACDAGPRAAEHGPDNTVEPDSAMLVLQASIGENVGAAAENQFSRIAAMLVTEDGTLWVVDGYTGATPQVRMYDADGRFVRRVGNVGSGPGEYRNPNALALLADGRVVLRDQNLADRLTVYTSAGTVDTTWFLGGRVDARGSAPRMVVDTSGLLWVAVSPKITPKNVTAAPPIIGYLRLRDGAIVDTVSLPALPELPWKGVLTEERLPGGGTSVRGVGAPYQASVSFALDQRGRFAIARTDQYRMEILPAHGAANGSSSSFIAREARPVPLSEDERAAEREGLIENMIATGLPTRRVPEVPRYKPPIKRLSFSSDGQLLVSVSIPSRLVNGSWMEPAVYDVFDQNGRFRGRVHTPDAFSVGYLKGDDLWGVWRDDYGVESIRHYRIQWPRLP
jgi:hypothetical protein